MAESARNTDMRLQIHGRAKKKLCPTRGHVITGSERQTKLTRRARGIGWIWLKVAACDQGLKPLVARGVVPGKVSGKPRVRMVTIHTTAEG